MKLQWKPGAGGRTNVHSTLHLSWLASRLIANECVQVRDESFSELPPSAFSPLAPFSVLHCVAVALRVTSQNGATYILSAIAAPAPVPLPRPAHNSRFLR